MVTPTLAQSEHTRPYTSKNKGRPGYETTWNPFLWQHSSGNISIPCSLAYFFLIADSACLSVLASTVYHKGVSLP